MPHPVAQDNWDLIQGESVVRPYAVQNPGGSAFNLTGYTLWCEFREEPGKPVQVTATVAIAGLASDGQIELQLSPTLSFTVKKTVKFDIYAWHPSLGATRLVEGIITLHPAITRPAGIAA